ncbi:LPXTG cell wall anchor domain-containing protein [Micromonospora zingiberis]|uniref:LPXTG cell wall anchor domain-containing protein n=1 Tax=Micromonospora zingiberis TaxID=2053011 RepID=A0A4R0GUK6_9ACTN|nr:LPXTG cell wall anchor domain-containing protein [Micromonospora zingiberis]TCB99619.1 LPXTG cell wall anchor domain-containing protein [Micromonospora zingiberis]
MTADRRAPRSEPGPAAPDPVRAYARTEVVMMVRTRDVPFTRPARLGLLACASLVAALVFSVTAAPPPVSAQHRPSTGSLAATAPPGSTGVTFEVLPSPTGSPTPDPPQPTPDPSPLPVTGPATGTSSLVALALLLLAGGGVLVALGRRRRALR